MRPVIPSCVLACRTALAPGQKGVEVSTVRGTVLDEAGQPVEGARVSIALQPAEYKRPIHDRLLGGQPMPWTRSDEEGRFALALLPAHLYLSNLRVGRVGLVVERSGYQSWRESIPVPLEIYRGSRVTLHELRPEDHARVVVGDPEPGTRVHVRRFDTYGIGAAYNELSPEDRVFDVPDDGVVTVPVPLLPTRPFITMSMDWSVLRHDVWLTWPGGRTAPRAIAPGQELRLRCTAADGDSEEAPRAAAMEPGRATLRIRVTDPTDRPIEEALPFLIVSPPGSGRSTCWIPSDPSDWFTDAEGMVTWDNLPARRVSVSASKPGWMAPDAFDTHELAAGEITEVHVRLRPTVDYRIHVLDAEGEAVPFAELKDEDWTYNADGTSSGSLFHVRADSLGVVRIRRPADMPLDLQEIDPRVRERRGKPVHPGDSELAVHRQPKVLLRTSPGQLLTDYSVPGALHSRGRLIELGGGVLWRGRASVAFGVRGAPPVVWVAPADPDELEGKDLLDVDRSRIVRRVPLVITGAAGVDLTELRAAPIVIEGQKLMRILEADMAERAEDGSWSLASRDGYRYDCRLLHPELLPQRVSIPRADAPGAAEPVSVELVKGARVLLRFSVGRDLYDVDRPELWVADANVVTRVLSGGPVYSGALPLTREQRERRTFALPMPCALEPGSYKITVQGSQGRAEKTVEIADTSPIEVDLGELGR